MKEGYLLKHHRLEKTHWYLKGRRDLLVKIINRLSPISRIIEVGCSTGALIADLHRQGYNNITGVDINRDAINIATAEGIPKVFVVDGKTLPFEDGSFDLVVACDVLEHIANEDDALKEWSRVLAPGGLFLITVPAFMFLWSGHDVENGHCRRYTAGRLKSVLTRNNFSIERVTYWNSFLFIPISAFRLLLRVLPKRESLSRDQLYEAPRFIGAILEGLLRFENILIASGFNFPLGVTVVAVGRKKIT